MEKAIYMLNNHYDFSLRCDAEINNQKVSIRVKFQRNFISRIAFCPVLATIFHGFDFAQPLKITRTDKSQSALKDATISP